MQIGYVRVSTNDQNTDLQRQALERAGCEQVFEEKMSGTVANRPALKKLLRTLNAGDTLVVWKLDRLGRSMRNLVLLVDEEGRMKCKPANRKATQLAPADFTANGKLPIVGAAVLMFQRGDELLGFTKRVADTICSEWL